jgi:hypothetical protein
MPGPPRRRVRSHDPYNVAGVAFPSRSVPDNGAGGYLRGTEGSRTLLEQIVMDEEGHKAWLELQIELIERIVEQAYSAKLITFGEDGDGDA